MEDVLHDIVRYLEDTYSPDVIILHGSRASGFHRENSDWDFYIFSSKKKDVKNETYHEQTIDIRFVQLPIDETQIVNIFGPTLQHACVVIDDTFGNGKKLLDTMARIYAAGFPLTEHERSNRQQMLLRVLNRVRGAAHHPLLLLPHVSQLYTYTVRYWFELQGLWSKPLYEALPHIQKTDSELYRLLEDLVSHATDAKSVQIAERVYQRFFK